MTSLKLLEMGKEAGANAFIDIDIPPTVVYTHSRRRQSIDWPM
jgi:hypothetical protein